MEKNEEFFTIEDIEDVKIIIKAKGKHFGIVPKREELTSEEAKEIRIGVLSMLLNFHYVVSTSLENLPESSPLTTPASPTMEWVNEIDKARFWSKVTDTGYCWNFDGRLSGNGYGMFKVNGKDTIASRVAYAIINGEIENNLHVLHKCDNPKCVNPDHLFTGTHQDNMLDKMRKGRGKILGRASKYHGVAWRSDSNNWRAQVFDGRKHIALGSHSTQEEAAIARDNYVKENNLDLILNFPSESSPPAPVQEGYEPFCICPFVCPIHSKPKTHNNE